MALGANAQLAIVLSLIDKASPGLDRVTQKTQTMGQKMASVGKSLTRNLTLPLLAVVGAGVKVYADFDKTMTNLEARTGATAAEMESFSEAAIKMGRDSAFSATQAADALLELTSSGSSASEAVGLLPKVLALASAGTLELGESADLVTDILAQFQKSTDWAEDVVDTLARSAQSSSASVRDMGQAFGNVGPLASSMGLSINDTAAALAVFHENGIKGAEAGTQLKSMLTNMSRNTNKVIDAWRDLGTSMFDAQGNIKDLDTIIADISHGLEGMTQQQRVQTIQALGGSFGQMGLNALLASDGIDAMSATMAGQASAAEVARIQMQSFAGQINQLKGSLETFMIVVVGPFVEKYLKPMVTWLVGAVNVVTDLVTKFPALGDGIMLVVSALILLGPALSIVSKFMALGKIFSGLTAVTGVLTTANFALAASWVAAALPIVALVAAIATIVAGIAWLVLNFDKVKIAGSKVWDYIKNAAEKFGRWLGDFVMSLPKNLALLFVNLVRALLGEGIANALESGLKMVKNAGDKVISGIKGIFGISSPSSVGAAIGQNIGLSMMQGVVNGIITGGPHVGKALGGLSRQLNTGGQQFARNAGSNVAMQSLSRTPLRNSGGGLTLPSRRGSGGVVVNIENSYGNPDQLAREVASSMGRRLTHVYGTGT